VLRLLRTIGLLLLLVGLLQPATVFGQRFDIPPRPSGPVLDQAGLLTETEERQLSQKLRTYETETSTAIVVVALPTLDGAPIADYAVELGREWGVGQGGKDNGAVILISRDERRMFIATGYGLEGSIPDAVASDLVRNVMRPAFRKGNFYEGIDRTTSSLMLAARGEYTASERPTRATGDDDGSGALFFVLLIILYFVFTSRRGNSGDRDGRRRRRGDVFIWGSPGGFGGGGGGGFGGGGFGGFGGGSFGGGGAGGSW